jgi:hypothetical protein
LNFKVLVTKFGTYLRPTNGPNGELVTNYLCGNPVRGNAAILRRGEASGRAFNIIQLETLWFEQREKCLFSEELLI